MNALELNVRAVSARRLISQCLAAGHELWAGRTVQWQLQSNVGGFNFQAPMNEAIAANAQASGVVALAENEFVMCSFLQLTCANPQNTNHKESFRYNSTDGFLGMIEIKIEPSPDPARTGAILDALKKRFTFLSVQELTKNLMPAPEVAALQLREAAVLDLHAQLAKLGGLLTTVTERDVELRAKRMGDLDAEHQARVQQFERERAAANERDELQRQTKQTELDRQEADLKKRHADLDDRAAKHARREKEKDLNTLLDKFEEFKVSNNTKGKRLPITVALIAMAVAFTALAVYGGFYYVTKLDAHFIPISSAGLLGFSATMLFYVKWSDRWFREHADEEVRSKRYKADMLRASWIAELTAEWVKEGTTVPPALIEVFARDLFATPQSVGETEHAADALLGLIKRTTKLDARSDGFTLNAGPEK